MVDEGAGGENMEGKTTLGVIGLIALVLWVATIATLGWFFINGWTKPAADGRTEIVLAPAERDQILAELAHHAHLLPEPARVAHSGLGRADIEHGGA